MRTDRQFEYARKGPGDFWVRWTGNPPESMRFVGVGDDLRIVCVYAPPTEIDRWADDGGAL